MFRKPNDLEEGPVAQAFCPSCGAPRIGSLRYCGSCRFDFESMPEVAEASPSGVVQPTPVGRTPTRTSPTFSAAEILVVIAIVAAAAVGAYVLLSPDSNRNGIEAGNSQPSPNLLAAEPTPTPSSTLTPSPVATSEPTSSAAPEPTRKATPEPVLHYALTFSGSEYAGNLVADAPYGPDFACEYGSRNGAPLATFIQILPSGKHVEHLIFKDVDGAGSANPQMLVIVDGTSYIWDRASNIQFEGVSGGRISYFAGGLGVRLDIDLHMISDSTVRLRVVGTLQCPPNPNS